MADVATLVIKVQGVGADKVAAQLKKLAQEIEGVKSVVQTMGKGAPGLDKLAKDSSRATNSLKKSRSAVKSFNDSILRLGRILASLAGIFYTFKTLTSIFSAGVRTVDEFRLATIGVAATLTDLAKNDPTGSYAQNLMYAKQMYSELELAAAKHFASGAEMIQAWNILTQKGVVLQNDQIDNLGVIVDRIKLSTQGQVSSIQIAQELRALLSGRVRMQDQLALLLKDRIPNLKQEVMLHKKQGDLLEWLADQLKGMKIASEDIYGTWTAQTSTFSTLISQIGRGGLTGFYEDMVWLVERMNNYLREHKDEIAVGIALKWLDIKRTLEDVADAIIKIVEAHEDLANQATQVVPPFKQIREGFEDPTVMAAVNQMWGKDVPQAMENISEGASTAARILSLSWEKAAKDFSVAWDRTLSQAGGHVDNWLDKFLGAFTTIDTGADAVHDTLGKPVTLQINIIADLQGTGKKVLDFLFGEGTVEEALAGKKTTEIDQWQERFISDFSDKQKKYFRRQEEIRVTSQARGIHPYSALGGAIELGLLRPMIPFTNVAVPADVRAGIGSEKEGGGGGKAADQENKRLLAIWKRLRKDEISLTGSTVDKIREEYDELYKEITLGKEQQVTMSKVLDKAQVVEAKELAEEQRKFELERAAAYGDKMFEIQQKWDKWLRERKGIAGAAEFATDMESREKYAQRLKWENELLDSKKQILDAAASLTPFLSEQLRIQELILQKEHERKMNQINIDEASGLNKVLADQLKMEEEITYQLKQQALERESWMTQGPMGGIRKYLSDRVGESDKAAAQAAYDWMKSLESTTTETIAAGIVGALDGSREDFQKVGRDIAQAFVERSVSVLISQIWDILAKGLADMLNVTMPQVADAVRQATAPTSSVLNQAATSSGQVLSIAGEKTGQAIYMGCDMGARRLEQAANKFAASASTFQSQASTMAQTPPAITQAGEAPATGAPVNVPEGLGGKGGGGFLKGFTDMFKSMFDMMGNMMKSLMNGLMNMLGGLLKSLGGIITKLISGLIKGIGGMFGGGMQHGGFVVRPTLAMIGESGPEAVIPLRPRARGNITPLSALGGGGLGDVKVTVVNETGVRATPDVRIDDRAIFVRLKREIVNDINQGGEVDRALGRKYTMNQKLVGRSG